MVFASVGAVPPLRRAVSGGASVWLCFGVAGPVARVTGPRWRQQNHACPSLTVGRWCGEGTARTPVLAPTLLPGWPACLPAAPAAASAADVGTVAPTRRVSERLAALGAWATW